MNQSQSPLIEKCEPAAQMFKALSHPQRLQILCLLADAELSVNEIESRCEASQSAVSQYLGRMKSEGWVTSRKDGHFVYYRILDPKIKKLIQAMHKIFC